VVSQYALAYPEIRFFLNIDGRTALQTTGSGKLIDVILEIYGLETAPPHAGNQRRRSRLAGRAGGADYGHGDGRGAGSKQSGARFVSFFVNRRVIGSRLLTRAVEEAYQGLLMQGGTPSRLLTLRYRRRRWMSIFTRPRRR